MENFTKKRVDSFRFAFLGLKNGFKKEPSLRIHGLGLFLVVVAGVFFHVNRNEWAILLVCCGFVIAAELMNTAIEKTCDLINVQYCSRIKYIKDVAAATVLVLAITSCIIALLIFGKYIFKLT